MASVEVKGKKISARVTERLQLQVNAAAKARGIRTEAWIEEAVRAKLDGEGVAPAERLSLARLDEADRLRVDRFVEYLDNWPEEIKDALMEAISAFSRIVRQQMKR